MSKYKTHLVPADRPGSRATLIARVSDGERAAIFQLARVHDRTPSREIRRAIRFYLDNFELVDRALRAQASDSSTVSTPTDAEARNQ